jgi:hypothetical protein
MNLACTPSPLRCFGTAVLLVLVVGIGAGAALADPPAQTHNYFAQGTRPDDRAGIHGVNGPSFMTAPVQTPGAVRPDDRGGIRGPVGLSFMTAPTQTTNAVRPDDRAGIRGIDSTTAAASEISVGRASNFDWGDAGVGAGSTLGLVLLAGGLLMARGRLQARVEHA